MDEFNQNSDFVNQSKKEKKAFYLLWNIEKNKLIS